MGPACGDVRPGATCLRFERAVAPTLTVRFGAIGFAALGDTFPGVSGTFDRG